MTNLYLKALELKARLTANDEGATAIEYGLIAAGIAVAIAAIVYTVGDDLVAMFEEVSTGIQGRG
ncbi:MAG: hypothetical protein A2521_06130 [Deltaproteobacteria bacterium RIFOXYD12_FULL_57_12]|nr:MAG: hypothetical protein A2521_06130 [Deltaproteobacteria bacterium RIFOXYD12_FULL_57_12]